MIISHSQGPCSGPKSHTVTFLIHSPTSPYVIMVCPHYGWLAVIVCLPSAPLRQHLKVMETSGIKTEIDHNRYAVTTSSFHSFCQVQQNTRRFSYQKPEILALALQLSTFSPLPALRILILVPDQYMRCSKWDLA